jgi:hypothetical protein
METMDTKPIIVESFVPIVPFVIFVRGQCGGEDQGHDEAAQRVADRRRHPITLTKLREQRAVQHASFAICPKQGRKSVDAIIRCKDGPSSPLREPFYA